MSAPEQTPQLYLISPPMLELSPFADTLGAILDAQAVACFRLSLATTDGDEIMRAADHLRGVCHARDVAIIIDTHFRLVEKLGLDGCHLIDGARQVRDVRKALGGDAIVGAWCGQSKHVGLSAGEAGCDYVAFGPIGETALGDGATVDPDLFKWWSEMVEIPVVAEGGLSQDTVREISRAVDFLALGAEIWNADAPLAAIGDMLAEIE